MRSVEGHSEPVRGDSLPEEEARELANRKFVAGEDKRISCDSPSAPRTVSVIIAARPSDMVLAAVETLESWRRPQAIEILVARGEAPSAQRNAAAREARGDLLLFLDDDSKPASDLIDVYLTTFRKEPGAAAIGGPAVYRGRSFLGRLAAAVLSEPLVTGRSASRWTPRGRFRGSDERELILGNLAVRRSVFETAGGFDEVLYPNEENLFLDRLRDRGEKVLYEPAALVTRPAPCAGIELARKVFGYGRGRAAQGRRRLSPASSARVFGALAAVLSVCATFAALSWTPVPLVVLVALLILYWGVLGFRITRREGIWLGLWAAPVACLTQSAYAAGIILGLLSHLPVRGAVVTVEKRSLTA
jgi:hypothetical protein